MFNITDEAAIEVVVEETLGISPGPKTVGVPFEYRRRIRNEIAAIKAAGGAVEIPSAYPDPQEFSE